MNIFKRIFKKRSRIENRVGSSTRTYDNFGFYWLYFDSEGKPHKHYDMRGRNNSKL